MAYAGSDSPLNYLGQLYAVGARNTPFLDSLGNPITQAGGLSPRYRVVESFEFSCAVPYDSGAGSQPSITEASSVTGVAATTKTRGQDTNTCQIYMRTAEVSYKKMSTRGTVQTGLAGSTVNGVTAGLSFEVAGNPVQNELDWQVGINMQGMASDLNYTSLNGTYQLAASQSTAAKTRGIITAITTNAVAAGSVALKTSHIDEVIKSMVDAGAIRQNLVAYCNSFQRQQLGKLYEFVPMDRFVGGSQINRIYTAFGVIDIVYDPDIPTDTVLLAEMSVIRLTFCPVEGQYIHMIDLLPAGASYKKQIYFQSGIDYGPEEYHGKITGLTTS